MVCIKVAPEVRLLPPRNLKHAELDDQGDLPQLDGEDVDRWAVKEDVEELIPEQDDWELDGIDIVGREGEHTTRLRILV